MPNAASYQKRLRQKLEGYFNKVDYERSVVKDAEDALKRDPMRYAPRLDLVIGPYNLKCADEWKTNFQIKQELSKFKNKKTIKFFDAVSELQVNQNPRYAVAIEVVFSGTAKHVLGDITNASTLGLYGFIIANDKMLPEALRILEHVQTLKGLRKIAPEMFNNVKVVSTQEFDNYFED